jgi:hypothetical protein
MNAVTPPREFPFKVHVMLHSDSLQLSRTVRSRRRGVRVKALLTATLTAAALLAAACGDPQVPTVATPVADVTPTAVVASQLTTIPSVRVLDARGKAIKNVLVRWKVTTGSGTVVNDSIRTSSSGEATSGGWKLGSKAGTQTLAATAEGLSSPVVFTVTGLAGPAAQLVALGPDQQQAPVNTVVPIPPSARVEDSYGNPVAGATITFVTATGDGTITGGTQVSNDQGIATATAWKLGTVARLQTALASLGTNQIAYLTNAVPGPIADIQKAGGDNQEGIVGAALSAPPGVKVVDAFGNGIGNVPVTFAVGAASGTITGTLVQTDPASGLAFVGSWVLGDATTQTLVATTSQLPGKSVTFTASLSLSNFKIDVRFIGSGGTARQREAFTKAAAKWRRIISGHVHDVRVTAAAGACGDSVPAMNEIVSDLVVFARIAPIDGVGKVLAQAGPCFINTASRLTLVGVMEFDEADLPSLLTSGIIDDVVLHEMGHVLGIGTLWNYRRTLLTGAGSTDPFFTGTGATAEFPGIGGTIYSGNPVPVENSGGTGTRDSHWRNSVFGRELMQGYAAAGGMPLSRVTAASLGDLGYVVNINNADPFRLAGALRSSAGVQTLLDNDIKDMPLYEVGPSGVPIIMRNSIRQKP